MKALLLLILPLTLLPLTKSVRADAKPEVKTVATMGVRAGRTTVVQIYGENLAPRQVTVRGPLTANLIGVKDTDAKLKGKGSKEVSVAVTVPADCPRDNFDLVLVQPDGTKVNAAIAVVDDAAVEMPIKKPASTFAQAMPLPGPSIAITGTLDGDTADLVRLDAKAGETWDISLLCGRAGSQLDPILRIRDAHHLSRMLSAGDKKKDRHLLFHVPADGTYYIEITEAEARGGPSYDYRLTINRKSP